MNVTRCLRVAARREELARVNRLVAELGELARLPPRLRFRVNLVVEELALNVMTHGRAAGARELTLEMQVRGDAVGIELADDGPRFNPLTAAAPPDREAPLERRRLGGLGVHLVRTTIDAAHYRYRDGRNHLTLLVRQRRPFFTYPIARPGGP